MTGSSDSPARFAHPLPPVCAADAAVLILGSFPSVRSRADAFYYAHPQNRFWPLMAALFEEPCPAGNAARTALLTAHRVALWDVIQSCEIAGSADSTIRQVLPNDIAALLRQAPIRRIFTNGATADRLYRRYCRAATGIPAVPLPSTSPANARCGFEDLLRQWRVITE